jgi:hypothetical protein
MINGAPNIMDIGVTSERDLIAAGGCREWGALDYREAYNWCH